MQETEDVGSISGLGMATYSSILAWEIPGTEEPGDIQSLKSQESGTI